MKKFIFLISFLLLPLTCMLISGMIMVNSVFVDDDINNGPKRQADSLARMYFPLNIGNSWTYKSLSSSGDTVYIKCDVVSDTIINNITYYRLSNELPYFSGKLITLDSSGNLYSFSNINKCYSFRKGILLDSLGAKQGDKVLACGENFLFGKCFDTTRVQIFGSHRKSKYFLSPVFGASALLNRFADGIGITAALKIGASGIYAASLTGCVLNNTVYGDTSTTTHIFGTVVYQDNNQPAVNGYVKALKLERSTGNILVLDSAQIQPDGHYYLRTLPNDSYYIVAYPNSEEDCDYVPTYFPSTINWQTSVKVTTGNNPENIRISVYRKTPGGGAFSIQGRVSSQVNQISSGIKEANVYIKQGNIYRSLSITKSSGQYKLNQLTSGTFEMIVNRLGYVNLQQNITVNNSNLQNINFFLEPTFIKVVNTLDNTPKKYRLSQNYPNPFNPITNIKFDIPKTAYVTLKIYNVTGKETAELVSDVKTAGSYEVDFNAANLSSGIYFYRIETNEFTETKRMMVVK
jgi:hypothetical protein